MGRGTYGATAFPMDDTIPQITEGVEIWSQSYTPTSNATNILIRVSGLFIIETSNIADGVVCAIFISGTNDAQFVMLGQKVDGGSSLHHGSCNGEILVSSWSGAKTISVRKGSAHHAVNYWLGSGHTTGTTMFGASVKATVTVQEIA